MRPPDDPAHIAWTVSMAYPAPTPQIVGLINWMMNSSVPFKVTSTWRPGDTGSFHSVGRAVDFAGEVPSVDSEALRRIYGALAYLGPECSELIYAGPGGGFWKNGVRTGPYAEAEHHNHVHIAMPEGWTYVPDSPDAPQLILGFPYEDGFVIVASDGAIYSFNCTYRGRLVLKDGHWEGVAP